MYVLVLFNILFEIMTIKLKKKKHKKNWIIKVGDMQKMKHRKWNSGTDVNRMLKGYAVSFLMSESVRLAALG